MWTPNYFVRYIEFPSKVEGVTIPNDDGTFDIYINSVFCKAKQQAILDNELCHIRENHFYNDILPIRQIEEEADGIKQKNAVLPNVFAHSPSVIPIFNSLDVFRNYMFAMREQVQKEKRVNGR